MASDLVKRAPEVLGFQHPLQKVGLVHRSVRSPCPSAGFIPWIVQGPLERPHGCLACARHDTTPPLLHAPCGAPFGPSARPRDGSAYLLPRLSALGCLTSVACGVPTLPSADFCMALRGDLSPLSPCRGCRMRCVFSVAAWCPGGATLFHPYPRRGHHADLPESDTELSMRRRRIDQAHPIAHGGLHGHVPARVLSQICFFASFEVCKSLNCGYSIFGFCP